MWIIILILVFLLAIAVIFMTPWNISKLSSRPCPVRDYAEAVQRIETLRDQGSPNMNPVCCLQLMTHGKYVDKVIILVHGYTNCPQQFAGLGHRYFDLGYNVLISPLPYHGLADRMTDAHSQLSAENLVEYADEVVDIAQGLGHQVTMMGISAGGVTTAWAAQKRNDINVAVIISPAFGFKQIPSFLTAWVMNIYKCLPNSFVWWNPVLQADVPPPHAYPRYSRHALVQILRLGFAVQKSARHDQPAAEKMVVVLNANDESVNNALTKEIVKTWQKYGNKLTIFEFDANLKLVHDLIDPAQPEQQIEIVYPKLVELSES